MSPASLRSAGEAGLPGVGVCVRMPRRLVAGSGVPLLLIRSTVQTAFDLNRSRKLHHIATLLNAFRGGHEIPVACSGVQVYHHPIESGMRMPMPYEQSQAIEQRLFRVLRLVEQGQHSAAELAEAVGVSIPTIARDIQALRQRGHPVVSGRCGRRWQYSLGSSSGVMACPSPSPNGAKR
jgi:biotin operon repressor